jgi:hypothetical protein
MFPFLQTGAVFKNDREGLVALAVLLLYVILAAQHSLLQAQWAVKMIARALAALLLQHQMFQQLLLGRHVC